MIVRVVELDSPSSGKPAVWVAMKYSMAIKVIAAVTKKNETLLLIFAYPGENDESVRQRGIALALKNGWIQQGEKIFLKGQGMIRRFYTTPTSENFEGTLPTKIQQVALAKLQKLVANYQCQIKQQKLVKEDEL